MRVYALLLGIALTTGYAFAAQVAVASVGPGRPADAAPDRVWYGGTIAPITVESGSVGNVSGETRPRQAP